MNDSENFIIINPINNLWSSINYKIIAYEEKDVIIQLFMFKKRHANVRLNKFLFIIQFVRIEIY